MQRGHRLVRKRAEQRQVQVLDVEMQQVELARARPDALEHQQVMGQGILHARIQPQRMRGAGDQAGRGA